MACGKVDCFWLCGHPVWLAASLCGDPPSCPPTRMSRGGAGGHLTAQHLWEPSPVPSSPVPRVPLPPPLAHTLPTINAVQISPMKRALITRAVAICPTLAVGECVRDGGWLGGVGHAAAATLAFMSAIEHGSKHHSVCSCSVAGTRPATAGQPTAGQRVTPTPHPSLGGARALDGDGRL